MLVSSTLLHPGWFSHKASLMHFVSQTTTAEMSLPSPIFDRFGC